MAKTNNDKLWSEAIMMAVNRREKGVKTKRLAQLADKLVAVGLTGDVGAMKEIGDRLQGRSITPIEARIEGNVTIKWEK